MNQDRRMKLRTLLTAGVVALVTCNAIASYALAPANLIIPGKSVGMIHIGDSEKKIRAYLGKPESSEPATDGTLMQIWTSPDQKQLLIVFYKSHKVVQIEFNLPGLATRNNITIRSSLQSFRSQYHPLKVRAYHIDNDVEYNYDAVQAGIAFSFNTLDRFDAQIKPKTLIIHVPGKPLLGYAGLKLAQVQPELPIPPTPSNEMESKGGATTTSPGLSCSGVRMADLGGEDSTGTHLTGSITNTSSKTFDYVEVGAVFYKGGNQIDSEIANTEHLEPGSTWNFDIPVLKKADDYKIYKVKGNRY